MLLLCVGILPWIATSSAQVTNITVQLAISGDTVGVTAGAGTGNARTAVSGAFTLTITYSEEVNGLTSSQISTVPSGAVSVTTGPTKSATDAKIWTATITPSTAGEFQLTVSPTGVTPATGNNQVSWSTVTPFYYDGPPTFSAATRAVPVAEGTSTSTNLATLNATDINANTISYAITATGGGADGAKFTIGGTNNDELRFVAVPDFENPTDAVSATPADAASNNKYIVVVTASSTATITGGVRPNIVSRTQTLTGTQTLTVTVTDVTAPDTPSAPTVTAAAATPQQLSVSWTAPTNTGRPAISDYDVQYRQGSTGAFTSHAHTGTGTTATITGLTSGTAYQVQVRATNAEGTSAWSTSGTATTATNVAPTFSSATTAFNVAENITTVTTATATDSDSGDTVSYSISGGADSAKFSINASTGAVTFAAAPDYENPTDVVSATPSNAASNNEYVVTITASSGANARALSVSKTLIVTVTDVNEPPSAPGAPTVTAAIATPMQLSVTWSAPTNTGKPAISDYDVQYRTTGTPPGSWQDAGFTGTGTSTTLTGLTPATAYQVQVRATNAEGTGSWSTSGTATTAANAAPVFSSSTTAFNVAENSTAVTTATATDSDTGDAVSYSISGGVDSAKFSINASTGAVTFASAPDFENPTDVVSATPSNAAGNNVYVVTITASSGTGGRALSVSKTLIVTVTDVAEAPGKPDTPQVTATTTSSVTISWSAPTNTGPAISDYDVQYRAGTSGSFTSHAHTGTATTATITGLTSGTSYEIQVRATNAEGTGSWSDAATGTPQVNVAPAFSSSATASVAENTAASTTVLTVLASDSDSQDSVTGYTMSGTDSGAFTFDNSSRVLKFSASPDFENPTDAAHTTPTPTDAANNNTYIVLITATSGTGQRVLTTTQRITVTVTDVNEPPSLPATFTVMSAIATPTKLSLSWTAPANTGKPAISGYDVQYRAGTSGAFTSHTHTGTGTSTTLTGLTQGTAYQVEVRTVNAEGSSRWYRSSATTAPNVAPTFSSPATAFSLAENIRDITTTEATDADTVTTDTVSYAIGGGADGAKFSIHAATGVLTFTTAPDYEMPTDAASTAPANAANNNEYVVQVQAMSGSGERALATSKTLIVTVTDVRSPGKPAVPQVTAVTPTSVSISWSAPPNTGLAITDYDVQYRQGNTGAFTDAGFDGTGTSTVLTGLTQNAAYQIQVRATNAEGTSPWSDVVTAVPQDNTSPVFSSSAAVTVAENTPASTPVVTVVAIDADPADEITGYALSGTDSGVFTFDNSSGVLRFRASPDYENPLDAAHTTPVPADAAGNNTYIVFITATSGTGGRQLSTTQRLTLTVTNVDEMALGVDIGSSVAVTDARYLTSEPSWTVTFDFSEPLATVGDAAFSVSDISVSVSVNGGAGDATFGELTLTDAARAVYSVPVTVTTEGPYTFQVKRGSVSTLSGDTYGGAGTPLVVIYNTPPVITDVAVVPPPAAGYTVGSELSLELTFDDDNVDIPANVDVANRPYIVLYLGERTSANQRRAYWQSARDANSTVVTFAYEVQPGDVANVINWEPRIVVPETAPITNGVSALVTSEPAGTDGPSDVDMGGIVAFPRDTTQPAPGQPQGPASPLTQEVPVRGSPVVFLPPTETVQPVKPTQIPRTPLIFNEIGNGAAGANDWVELRNVTAEAVPLKNWSISIVTDGKKVDEPLIVLPSDASFSVPPNGILLLTQRPPAKTRLAGGIDITNPGKQGAGHRYLVAPKLTLPGDGQFLLILRNAKGKLGKGENVIDVAGGGGRDTDAFIADKRNAFQTDIWPLKATKHPRENTEAALAEGKVWRRAKADIVGYHKDAWAQAAYTGVGYDRATETSPATAGTPGYPNDAVKPMAATPRGSVTFSEIMVDSAGGNLPQWIELYNASKTAALNLNRWKLEIQNVDSEDLMGRPVVTLTLKEKVIQPNQTLLIVTGDARASSADVFPASRVYNLLKLHEKNLRIKTPRDTFLSAEGFTLKLSDSAGQLVDEIGNTDGHRRTKDAPAWQLPFAPVEAGRSSLIRRYDKGTAEDGKAREGWVLAANITRFSADVYYGHADDKGTPGYREGGALPVELTHFQMARTEAGVVIRWATASEVENAGFSILRSDTGKAAFRSITPRLISGAGTTGERSDYAFTDETAKPGIAYAYRLESVSLAGRRETLATQRVKAGFTPAHRQLTTFGAVKQLD